MVIRLCEATPRDGGSAMGALANRFTEFCRSIAGIEEIDAMIFSRDKQWFKRADFLLDARSVICEVKSLETDTAPKFAAFLKQEGIDLPPGEYSVRGLWAEFNGRWYDEQSWDLGLQHDGAS